MSETGSVLLAAAAAATKDFWSTSLGEATTKAITCAVIIVAALLIRFVAHLLIRLFVERIVTGAKRKQNTTSTQVLLASPVAAVRTVQRTRTLGSVLNNIVSVLVVVIAALMVLTELAPNITGAFSLITAAVGAGLGFGAQTIVKDVLTGLFMVIDDQLGVGDVIETDLASGIVEDVGIRVTQIRDVNGVLWWVRNGELTRIGNVSQGWSRALVDVTVPRDADVELVQQRMLQTATELAADPKWKPYVVEKPELWGLESVTADGLLLRVTVKTRANAQADVSWALRIHVKEALDELQVQYPALSSAPLTTWEQPGPLRGVRPPRTAPTPTTKSRRRHPRQSPQPASAPLASAGSAGAAAGTARADATAAGATGAGAAAARPAATGPDTALQTPITTDPAASAKPARGKQGEAGKPGTSGATGRTGAADEGSEG